MPPRRPARRRDSRTAVLDAARAEFAASGFAGARVDLIARRARLNKAMLYYHFGDKRALYRAVLREGFTALIAHVRAATDAPGTAIERLDSYVAALLDAAERQPALVPIVLRELAGGGRHLDAETLHLMVGLFQVIRDLLDAGQQSGEFRPVDPLLTHLMVMGAAMTFVANKPVRERIRQLAIPGGPEQIPSDSEPFARHLALVLRRTLCSGKEPSSDA